MTTERRNLIYRRNIMKNDMSKRSKGERILRKRKKKESFFNNNTITISFVFFKEFFE